MTTLGLGINERDYSGTEVDELGKDVERHRKLEDARAMLDWFEDHPSVPLPQELDWAGMSINKLDTKDEAVELIHQFGSCKKEWQDDLLVISKSFGALPLKAYFWRRNVCERVVVGVEEIPEHVEPAKIVEKVEWRCAESLLGDSK